MYVHQVNHPTTRYFPSNRQVFESSLVFVMYSANIVLVLKYCGGCYVFMMLF